MKTYVICMGGLKEALICIRVHVICSLGEINFMDNHICSNPLLVHEQELN